MPSCVEGLDRYSLQEDNYLFVTQCPPGYSCDGVGTVTVLCCDGTELSATVGEDLLATERAAIISAMLNEAGRRLAFCDDPVTYPEPEDPRNPTKNVYDTPILFYSPAVTVSLNCPDGTEFSYTLAAGRFLGFYPDRLAKRAKEEALRLAKLHQVCLSALPSTFCVSTVVDTFVKVTGAGVTDAHSWALTSGTLPTGLTLETGWVNGNKAKLTGTPTAAGTFTFSIQATNSNGDHCQRSYTVCVLGLSPASLPDGAPLVAYSETLTAPACAAAPLSWQVTAGSLPPGLTLDEETGEISGVPEEGSEGTYNFTVTLQTEAS